MVKVSTRKSLLLFVTFGILLGLNCFSSKAWSNNEQMMMCSINVDSAVPTACDENGQFFIDLQYQEEEANGMFNLLLGNEMLGSFAYGEPLSLGPFNGNGTTEYIFTLQDVVDPDCIGVSPVVIAPDCSNQCTLVVNGMAATACDNDDQFFINIGYGATIIPGAQFTVSDIAGTTSYGTFTYGDDVLIGPFAGDGSTNYAFTFTDVDNPECSAQSGTLTAPTCPDPNACSINVTETIVNACDANQQFTVGFGYEFPEDKTGQTFSIADGSTNYGTFTYGESVTIGPINGDGTSQYTFLFSDTESPSCIGASENITAPSCPVVEGCSLSIGNIIALPCNASGEVALSFAYDVNAVSTDSGFTVSDGTSSYGPFNYSEEFSFGSYIADGSSVITLTMTDISDISCASTPQSFTLPTCGEVADCSLTINEATTTLCDSGDQFHIRLGYQAQGIQGTTFTVSDGSTTYGPFNYNENFEVGPFNGGSTTPIILTMIDGTNTDCSATAPAVIPPDCSQQTGCAFQLDEVVVGECDLQNEFLVTIGYAATALAGSSFSITDQNSNSYGTFDYGDNIILGPLQGDGTSYVFTLTDNNDANCSISTATINAPACLDACNVTINNLNVSACDENNMFSIALDYTFDNAGNSFIVTDGIGINGPYNRGDNVVLGPYTGDGSEYNITIIDAGNSECRSTSQMLTAPSCLPAATCAINVVSAIPACSGTDFFVAVNYNFTARDETMTFNVLNGTTVIGTYNYGEALNLGPFNGDGSSTYSFSLVDVTDETCSASTPLITAPNCEGDPPQSDIVANDDQADTFENTGVTIIVLSNDTGNNLAVEIVSQPSQGTATLNDNNTIGYTPNTGFSGGDSFRYAIRNTQTNATDTAVVRINVLPLPDNGIDVIANNDSFITNTNTSSTIQPLINDQGLNITIQSANSATGTVEIVNNGTELLYTPAPNTIGIDTIIYTIVDANGDTSTGTIIMSIVSDSNQNFPPNIDTIAVCTEPITPVTICYPFSDPNGDDVYISEDSTFTTFNCGLAFVSDSCLRYTPLPGLVGTDTVHIYVCDRRTPRACSYSVAIVQIGCAQPIANDDQLLINNNNAILNGAGLPDVTGVNGFFLPVTNNDVDLCGATQLNVQSIFQQPANGSVTITQGQIDYTPNAGFSGSDSFQYITCNECPLCDTATVVVTVDQNIDCNRQESTCVVTNSTGQICPTFCNLTWHQLVDVRAGNGALQLVAEGCYNYAPNTDFTGTDTLFFEACEGDYCETLTVITNVQSSCGNSPPVAVDDMQTANPGETVPIAVLNNDSDADGDPITVTQLLTQPACGSVELIDNIFYYTATANCSGDYTFNYEVCDDTGLCDVATVTITVVNDCQNDEEYCTEPIVPITICIDFCGLAGSDTTFIQDASTTFNCSITLLDDNCVQYTPLPGFFGGDVVTFIGENELGQTDTVRIPVNISCSVPNAMDDEAMVSPDESVIIDVIDNDNDPCGNLLSPTLFMDAANGSVTVNSDGTVTYTPQNGFTGTDTFSYLSCNDCEQESFCDTAIVVITVEEDSIPPMVIIDVEPDIEQTPFGTPVIINVLNNDEPSDLIITSIQQPTNGTVTENPDGTLTYTPNEGFSGTDYFFYEACDSENNCEETIVSVEVLPEGEPNQPPTANNDTEEAPLGTPVVIDVLVNDSDPEGSALTVEVTEQPTNGTVMVNQDGTVTYTPNEDAPEEPYTDEFTYVACDNGMPQACDTAMVVIGFGGAPINLPPVAGDNFDETTPSTPITIDVLSNDSDPNGDPITVSMITDPVTGTATLNPDGTITYTPDDGFTGNDFFVYVVCDNGTPVLCDTAFVSISVEDPNDFEAVDDQVATGIDMPIDIPVTNNDELPTGTPLDSITISIVDMPMNGTPTINEDGTISYTPNPGFEGTDEFTYEICIQPAGICDTATVIVNVLPPVDAEPDVYTTQENTPISFNVLDNDTGFDLSITNFIDLPDFGTLESVDQETGDITYVPFVDFTGEDFFSYVTCDGSGMCDTAVVGITILPVSTANLPPVAGNDQVDTPEDTPVDINVLVNDSDPNGDPVVITEITQEPENGTTVINEDGTITYTPNPGFTGCDVFEYQICDTQDPPLCTTASVGVSVGENTICNEPPIAFDNEYTIDENTQIEIDVLDNGDFDPDGTIEIVQVITEPAHGELIELENSYIYIPDNGYAGRDFFMYVICDNGEPVLCDTATVTINIIPESIQIQPDIAITGMDEPVNINVLGNDLGGGLTVTNIVHDPEMGTIVLNPDGTFTYTPDSGFVGTDYFGYQACDEDDICDETLVTVIVLPDSITNVPPNAVNDVESTPLNTPVDIDILANDTDPYGGDEISIASHTEPENGTIEEIEPGVFTYTPNENFAGRDEFTYVICDNGEPVLCDSATVVITVGVDEVSNNPPVAVDDFEKTDMNEPIDFNILNNDVDPDGDNITIVFNSLPEHGTISEIDENGTVSYTPDENFVGQDFFSYVICDDGEPVLCDTAYVQIFVEPDTLHIDLVTEVNTSVTACIRDYLLVFEIDTISVIETPNDGSLIIINDCVRYIPNPDFVGMDTLLILICNEEDECIFVEIEIDVLEDADPPVANDDVTVTGINEPVTIPVLDNDFDPNDHPITEVILIDGPFVGDASIMLDSTGLAVIYTPHPDSAYVDSFSYVIVDSTGMISDTAWVIVNITDEPLGDVDAVEDEATTLPDTSVDIDILENDIIPPDAVEGTIVVTTVDPPNNGTAILNPDNTYTYIPDLGFEGTDTFTYELCVTLQTGIQRCDTTEVIINVQTESCEILCNPIITPDGNNINDELIFTNLESSCYEGVTFKLYIFNRWGDRVYEVPNYTNEFAWDGRYLKTGNPVPDGTYFFQLWYEIDGEDLDKLGSIEVRR